MTSTDYRTKVARMNGYAKGQPDTGWWIDQLREGLKFRKKLTKEARWDTWRRYYKGEFSADILPSNIFFKVMRTVVPRIYFRNPSISISPGHPGFEAAAFAKILERVDNKLFKAMKIKRQVKKIAQNSFMFGTGFGKLGYGAEYNFSPALLGDQIAPLVKQGRLRIEYDSSIKANMPWFKSVHPGTIILPSGCSDVESSRWIAHWIRRNYDDVKSDPRLKNTRNLKIHGNMSEENIGAKLKHDLQEPLGMIDLVELRDKKTQRVIVMCPFAGDNKVLYDEYDEMQSNGGVPFYPLVFNEDDQYAWGTPDSQILEPQQLEINETKTQIMRHRRMSLVKILVEKNGMTEEQAQKMVDATVAPVIFTEKSPQTVAKVLEAAQVPDSLFKVVEDIMREIRENIGFGRNEFGEFNPGSSDTTATEAGIVAKAAGIRVDERRDMIADLLVDLSSDIHNIIFKRWDQSHVIDVVGPDGSVIWVQFKGTMLKGMDYHISIDPDTSIPETKELKEQRATRVFELLRDDPYIDQIKLRKNFLRSLQGAQYEDMIREDLGMQPGQNPGNPMDLGQFQELLQRGGGGDPFARQLPVGAAA